MGKLLDSLINYLDNATPEQLERDWKELEPFSKIGPSVDEYVNFVAQNKGYKNSDEMIRKQTTPDV